MGGEAFAVADPTLAGLLDGLLAAGWRSLCLFTGRHRWAALAPYLGRGAALELHLDELTSSQTLMLMDNLPRLRRQPLEAKIAMLRKVGGHPHSIELLEGWLASGRVHDLLDDPALDGLLRAQWEDYFLTALLARLTAAQRDALARLCIFRINLGDDVLAYAGVDAATVQAWLDLSLLQREQITPAVDLAPEMQALLHMLPESERRKLEAQVAYSIHPMVREYLLSEMSEDERRELHLWAAAYHGQPFVDMARQAAAESIESWTDDEIEILARSNRGVVGEMVRRTDDIAQAQAAMTRALVWQQHLFRAAAYEQADDIVNAVYDILDRWGQRDRAKALLRGSIATLAGFNRAVAQGNLANMLQDEGKLDEVLAIHEELYRFFASLNARQQMAAALNQQGYVLLQMGRYPDAISMQEAGLNMKREDGNEEGQAISLHQLSILYHLTKEYTTALACSQEAGALARKMGNEMLAAATLHEQGLIYTHVAGAAEDETAAAHRQQAFDHFRQSLEIERRIGNEAGAADSLGQLGTLLRDAGRMSEAIAAFYEYVDTQRRLGNPTKLGVGLEWLGSVHERQGQYAAALEKYEQALALAQKYFSPQDQAVVERDIARVKAKLGRG